MKVPVASAEQYAHWAALTAAVNRTGRRVYLDYCPHAIGTGKGTETKGKLMHAPGETESYTVQVGG